LIQQKLRGQTAVLTALPDSDAATAARSAIDQGLAELTRAGTMQELRLVEAQAAREYFTAWSQVPVSFTRADQQRVPEHWHSFGGRVSPITSANRRAANPANAILNYLFALIEAEASLACHAVGLDPGIGLLHADQKARDSLALDLMEPIRPEAEHYLLELLTNNTFRARDFHETRTGNCRLLPLLSCRLADTLPAWATLLGPVAEQVARTLACSRQIEQTPTLLSQRNRRAGRASLGHNVRPQAVKPPRLPTCKTCGNRLASTDRTHCDQCLPAARAEQKAAFAASGPAALARRRAEGRDPAHGGAASKRRSQTMRKRQLEAATWERQHANAVDPAEFEREILPRLQGVPLNRLVQATGLSLRYVSQIRRGQRVPHPRHWDGLRTVTP
jgi:hypothetical protein